MSYEICQALQAATCSIKVFLHGEEISHGSGFSFLPSGEVITAAHVVTGRVPLREADFEEPGVEILCKFSGYTARKYKVAIRGFQIQVPGFINPVDIDFSMLVPIAPIKHQHPFLTAVVNAPKLGSTVYAAGFSDEIELPFGLGRNITAGTAGSRDFFSAMRLGYEADMLQLMCKKAMVGNSRRFSFSNTNIEITGELYYLDNGMHSGASGGPVVNTKGEAVGLITQRAVTSLGEGDSPKLRVPSGSTLVLSLGPMRASQANKP